MTICKPLQNLTSSRAAWIWNASYQAIYDKAKSFIKADACMKFHDQSKPLYPETDVSGVGLGPALLLTRDGATYQKDTALGNIILQPIAFSSKSLISAEHRYINIEREVLAILHGLEKFHHYCFTRDVNVITDHKPLMVIFKKDIVTLSQRIQCILLRIHQYRVRILYKPGPEIFIANWLSWHKKENKDKAIHGMDIRIYVMQIVRDVPECMSIQLIQQGTSQDELLQWVKCFIITSWPDTREQLHQDIRPYWSVKDNMLVIDGVIMKGRHIIIPKALQQQALY